MKKYHSAVMAAQPEPSVLEQIAEANRTAEKLEREAAYFDECGMPHVARTRRRFVAHHRDRADRLRTRTLEATGRIPA